MPTSAISSGRCTPSAANTRVGAWRGSVRAASRTNKKDRAVAGQMLVSPRCRPLRAVVATTAAWGLSSPISAAVRSPARSLPSAMEVPHAIDSVTRASRGATTLADCVVRERDRRLAMAGAMPMAAMCSSGLVGLGSGVTLASTVPIGHVRRVNLIERQRDQRESAAVSCARAPQRPIPAPSSLLSFATHPAAATRNREPSWSNGLHRRADSVENQLHRYRPGSAGRDLSPAYD